MENEDNYISGFNKKLSGLLKNSAGNTRQEIRDEIRQIQKWLTGDRSIIQLHCYHAFMKYLIGYTTYQDYDTFIIFVKFAVGFVKHHQRNGKIITVHDTVALGQCSQKKFNLYFDKVKEFAEFQFKIKFIEWHENSYTQQEF